MKLRAVRGNTWWIGVSFFLLAVIIACTGPTSAEPPPTLSQASYDADTQRLTLTLSDGSTIQADLNDFVTSGELPAAVSDALPQTAAPTPAPPTVSGSSYDPTTQLLTLTRTDGSAFQADLGSLATYDELSTMAPDVSVESARYDNATTQLLLTLSDDSIIRADLSRLSTDTDLAAVVLDNAELVATLIASQPTPQEPITVQDASYDARTTTLTLTLSDRTTIQADLNALITTTELTAVVAALPATPTPVPTPTPTPAPAMVEQARTFDLSVPDMGQPNFSLSMQDYLPQRTDGITTHEAMFATDAQGMVVARLVTAYELNAAGLVYTFHLRKGVPWHNNHGEWGEFDADDFLFSWQGAAVPSSLHPIAEDSRRTFTCEACQMVKVDDHTVQLIRTTPTGEITWHSRMPLRASLSMHSKKHYDAKGAEEANRESVGTGPWVLTSATTGVDRRFEAVLDHWNKSPEFAEMIWHEIYEESTRRAVFLSRQIDTGSFTPESIQVIRNEDFADVKYMSFPGAIGVYLNLLGQQYYTDHPHHLPDANGDIRVPLDENAYDCSFAWVSCDRDTESEEWDNARKVRQAMNHSIDRQKLINNLAFGEGQPLYHIWFTGHSGRMKQFGLDQLTFEYDVALARQLLQEAGYEDGFEIDMALTIRPSPGAVENGEAVCTMWLGVGIQCNQQNRPFSEFRPTLVSRAAKGASTQATIATFEPLRTMQILFNSTNSINFGLEHPDWQAMMEDALATVDEEERWRKQAEMAKWLHEHALTLPTYSANAVFPIGPEIDPWQPMAGIVDWLNNFEYVPHRK